MPVLDSRCGCGKRKQREHRVCPACRSREQREQQAELLKAAAEKLDALTEQLER